MKLEVKSVYSGYFPEVDIVKGISMSAESGKITGIVGPNGCGKSTLLKTIYGFLKPTRGEIRFAGKDITSMAPHDITKSGMIMIPQTGGVFPDLTVEDNLRIAMWGYRKDEEKMRESFERVCEVFPMLEEKKNDKASCLSGGMKKMLEAGRVYLYDSKIVLLDEATAGLAPIIVKDIVSMIEDYKQRGIGIVVVDHNIRMLTNIADYMYSIGPTGELVAEGPGEQFRRNLEDLVKSWI